MSERTERLQIILHIVFAVIAGGAILLTLLAASGCETAKKTRVKVEAEKGRHKITYEKKAKDNRKGEATKGE